ncbi:hypothetical protein ACF1FC_30595 [Streptomyces sp. NPDC014344]|uniref:hypothetical protein n=1 Tax=Streptomyces sp. NPDC014344 TaxID=3364871 RepID=UPI0036F6DBE3
MISSTAASREGVGEGVGVGLGVAEGRAEVLAELPAPGVDGPAPDADEDEQPLARSAVAESSARPPRASFRRRTPSRAEGAASLRGRWGRAVSVGSVSGAWRVKQELLKCFRDTHAA